MTINDSSPIDELVRQGKYQEAAEQAEQCGAHGRAADLYERIWDFGAAARCARAAGDYERALVNAIEYRDNTLVAEIEALLCERGEQGTRAALEIFAGKRWLVRAGRLAEKVGEIERAVELYQDAHQDFDAARLLVELERDRDAGVILERLIDDTEPGGEQARAHLELGLILARRMQHQEAIRHLQEAARFDEPRARAQRALVVELASLGLRDAAREVLLEIRQADPSVTADLEQFVRSERPTVSADHQKKIQLIGGRYRLGKLLGSGGSGRVYRARDEITERDVAVKLFISSSARGEPAYERFVREAAVARHLRHPNIVEVYDFSADLGYLVMELLTGGSLRERLSEELTEQTVRRLALELLAALEFAHQRGIIHRDVKPENIFFDTRGTAKLGDFGVAHLLDLGQTQTGGLIGTLAYMSPEQITGAPLTVAADFYAVGVTLFEALTGRLPFQGPDFVAQHLGEQPPNASSIAPLHPGWDALLGRLLAKSPGERHPDLESIRTDLAAIDMGDKHAPLFLPRSGDQPAAGSSTSLPQVRGPAGSVDEESTRYAYETPIGETSTSTLSRAVDVTLDRSVIIERHLHRLDEDQERHFLALARGGGPFVQRVLAYERDTGVAVYEAPAGRPLADIDAPVKLRFAARLLKRLARAVVPLHEADRAHGGIGPTSILLDDRGQPTILVSGMARAFGDARPPDDVNGIIEAIATIIEAPPTLAGLVDTFLPSIPAGERLELLNMPLTTGEELYAAADRIEMKFLQVRRLSRLAGESEAVK